MRHLIITLALVFLALGLAGCATSRPASQAYTVDANGAVSAGTRSALDGTTAPGKQELIGIYLPFPPFAVKAGLEWDGTTFGFGSAPAPQAAVRASGCTVEQTYTVEECYTEMVPVQKTRQVQRTRSVPAVSLPVPQAATNPCPEPVALATAKGR